MTKPLTRVTLSPTDIIDIYCELNTSFDELLSSLETDFPNNLSKLSLQHEMKTELAYLINVLCNKANTTKQSIETATEELTDEEYIILSTLVSK